MIERPMPPPLLALVVVVLAADITLTWELLIEGGVLDGIARATGGLVQPPLVAMGKTALLLAPIVFGLGRLRPRELGLVAARVAPGAAATLTVWAGVQVVLFAGALIAGRIEATPVLAGSVVAQLLGTALIEEAIFRGLLFGQLRVRWDAAPAAAVSSLAFALWHVPQHLWLGYRGLELVGAQAVVLAGGVLACLLYLGTRNLFVVVGLHALFNEPAALVASPVHPQVALGGVIAVAAAAIAIRRRNRQENNRNTGAG
jgi:membrane protease YdiL (CAAX protease family)